MHLREARKISDIAGSLPALENLQSSARASRRQHVLRSAQRCRDAPTRRMLDVVNVLAQFFVPRSSRPAIRICEKPNGTSNIETCTQKVGKALGCVHGNVVEPVKLIDDHQLDQLIEGERFALRVVLARSVGLVDQVTAE